MKKLILLSLVITLCLACNKLSDEEKANVRIVKAYDLVENNQLNAAKMELDSVHLLYPREVSCRRAAKALSDSITYIEAQRSYSYADSLLSLIAPKVDSLQKKFRFNKEEKYQDQGEYVHRLLQTTSNTNRCYLQVYVQEDGKAIIKSYFYGSTAINHDQVTLSANEEDCILTGKTHQFNDGVSEHEIVTIEGEKALEGLNFVSAHMSDRIKVTLSGKSKYVYYLTDSEKTAIEDTYRLAMLMTDKFTLDKNVQISQLQIIKFEQK